MNDKTRKLTETALLIALGTILSLIQFPGPWVNGGSITLCAMLPICLYAAVFGLRQGLLAGLALGILQLFQDLYVVHWAQLVLDYFIAFACYGLAGLFPKKLPLGLAVAALSRMLCSVLSGVIFFAEYAEGWSSVWAYSIVYNGSYMIPELILCILVSQIPVVKRLSARMQAPQS